MTVAHTEHASSSDELEDHGKEFRSFRSEGSIRGHSERDEKSAVSLNDVSPSFPLPVFLAKPYHGPLRPEGHGDLRGSLRDERSIKSHHIYVPNGLRPPFFALSYPYYRHIFVYPFFNSVPGRGSVPTADERRQCSIIVYDDLLLNAHLVERAPKQYGHAHTFHRSTSSVGLALRSPVKAFPRNLRSGLPLRRISRSGDSRLNPNQNLLMPDG